MNTEIHSATNVSRMPKIALLIASVCLTSLVAVRVHAQLSCENDYVDSRQDGPSWCSLNEEQTHETLGGGGCIYYMNPTGITVFCRNTAAPTKCVPDYSITPSTTAPFDAGIVRTYCVDNQCTWNVWVTGSDTTEFPGMQRLKNANCPLS